MTNMDVLEGVFYLHTKFPI